VATSFKILEHPADVGIEAYGETMEKAFEHAAAALVSLITDPRAISARETRVIEIHAKDQEQLLVKWLSELLYLYDAFGFLAAKTEMEKLTSISLKSKVRGETFDAKVHPARIDVKAITYHQIAIEKEPRRITLRVFVDI
jgi:SHS2 domain-containing protein